MWQQFTLNLTTIFLLCVSVASLDAVEFPAPIIKCHISDEKCHLEQAHNFLAAHPHGIPELGIEDLDPYKMGNIDILSDGNNAVSFNLYLSNVEMLGFSDMKLLHLRGFTKDLSKPMILQQTSYQPQLILKAKYRIDGKILVLPIKGEGDFEWLLSGVSSKFKIVFKPELRNGKTYLRVEDYKTLTKMDNVKTNATNLFNGDKALSDNILKVINENWELFSNDISPKINEALANEQTRRLNKFLELVPYDDFFLPDE